MANNPSDIRLAVTKESVPGTTPANPSYNVLDTSGSIGLKASTDWLDSSARRADRQSAGGRKINKSISDGFTLHMHRDAGVDVLLESGLSGTFSGDTLKASNVDTPLTFEKRMTVAGGYLFRRFEGCYVSKLTLTGDASSNVELAVEVVGMDDDTDTAEASGSTYINAADTLKLDGEDVVITVAGVTLDYTKFELSIESSRAAQFKMGSAAARGVGTEGNTAVKGSLEFFRDDWSPETVMVPDEGVELTITLAGGADGLTFTIPSAQFRYPEDGEDGAKVIASVEFSGKRDDTEGTSILVTKLA